MVHCNTTSCTVYCNTLLGPWFAASCTTLRCAHRTLRIVHCVLYIAYWALFGFLYISTFDHFETFATGSEGLYIKASSKCWAFLTCMDSLTVFGDKVHFLHCVAPPLHAWMAYHVTVQTAKCRHSDHYRYEIESQTAEQQQPEPLQSGSTRFIHH